MKEIIEKIKKLGKKTILIIVGFLVLIIVIIFGGAFAYNKFFYKRSYSEIESIMLNATMNHMSKHQEELPKEINDVVSLSVNDLVRLEEMEPISEYTKDETINCDGNVIVTNVNTGYRYTPILKCGNKYETTKFVDYLKDKIPVVTTGNGLYNINEELVYRGDNVNNFIKLSDKMYRIVKVAADEVVIIYNEKLEPISWDDRYNVQKGSNLGINDYSVSKIRDYLINMFEGKTLLDKDETSNSKSLVIAFNLNIGKRNKDDSDKSGKLEQGAVMEKQFIGLLPLYDFLNASLDANCISSDSPSCENYNYLATYPFSWWTATGTSSNTYQVYKISKHASLSMASSSAYARPVLHLVKDALYVSGDGTEKNPYIIK